MIDMSSEDEDYSEILSPTCDKRMVGENYRYLANSIFDFNREKTTEITVERSKWLATAKGLSIALFGAGVGYGCQSVFVNQLAAQDPPINAMESLFFRSVFQSLIFLPAALIKNVHMVPPEGYQIRVFTIALCYIVATMASFQAFTMIAPGAALGARCSSRTFFAILLSFFCLKEKILKFEIFSVFFCTAGLLFYAGDSITRSMSVNNGTGLPQNLMIELGFGLCAIAGLSRSVGMTMYRKIKVEIDPVTIVLVHSLMTVIAVLPIMLEFENFNLPKTTTGWIYLLGACCSATIATFSSNWAIQYINPGLASVAQNTDIIVSVTLEHLVIKTLPSGLEIAAVIFVLLGTSSLPLFRYWESLKNEQEEEDDDAKALLK